jgi:hypothetical protein
MFMHSRGVHPWTTTDTLGSTLLLTFGAALVGAASVFAALTISTLSAVPRLYGGVAVGFILLGALCLRLGLLALRKLT